MSIFHVNYEWRVFFFPPTAVDDIAPVILGCPNTIQYEAPLGSTSAPVTWNDPSSSEGGVVVTQTATPGSNFPLGTSQVSYTFTDLAGNSATCTFTIIITREYERFQMAEISHFICNGICETRFTIAFRVTDFSDAQTTQVQTCFPETDTWQCLPVRIAWAPSGS